jgi:hypothetical protein
MEALDLTRQRPRSPQTLLDDLELLMMARTVDKIRATLPGGNLGVYWMTGFSERMLEALGIEEEALRQAVASASSDKDVAQWVRENSDPSRYEAINVAMQERKIADMLHDDAWVARYPIVKRLPPEMSLFDMLIEDDAEIFGKASTSQT